jgi:hypothetical protein
VGTAAAESAATVAESTAAMTAAAMTAAAVTTPTPMGSHVARWDETQRQDREEGAEDSGSSCHDSLRFKLPDAARN